VNPLDARNAEIIRLRDEGVPPHEVRKSLGVTQGIINKVYSDAIERRRRQEVAQRSALLNNWGRHASSR
jgi:hypothetical protein